MNTPTFKNFNIEPYKPGKSKIKNLKNIIKLSANESALGMSPKATKIIFNKKLNLERYPDGKSQILRKEISKKFKCDPDKIICGAGSDEVIQMICQLFLTPKDEVIVPDKNTIIEVGDNVIFITMSDDVSKAEEIFKVRGSF